MPLETVDSLVESLRGRPILRPEQFETLTREYAPAHGDTQELARTLIRLRWLTVYQAKKLIAGKADELVVGPYVVLDKLGEGGMGRVYKAVQLNLGRVVALKVVRTALLKNETALKRFRREVKAAADLNHPNIVRVFDADQVGDKHFLAMEYIAGYDLTRLVKERGTLPISMACSYIRQAALGLQHAHDRKMVHRDIKPSNLLVAADAKGQYTPRNVLKILDMGLARIQNDDPAGEQISTELTRTGTVIGTPDFMSPEQAKNSSAVDHRSDMYALGCTLYFLLTGDPPFPNGTPLEKLLQHQMDPPKPVHLLRTDVPPEVATIVHCLLAKRPDDRFQSGGALAHALEPWCAPSAAGPALAQSPAVLQAEAVDPSSMSIETPPNDPFDFADDLEDTQPEPSRRVPPPPKPKIRPKTKAKAVDKRDPRVWLVAGAAALALLLMVAVGIAIASRKKPGESPTTTPEPARHDVPKPPSKVVKVDPPAPRDLDTIERYLPDDTSLVVMFDVKQMQAAPAAQRLIIAPLAEKLADLRRALGIDLLSVVERVVVGFTPDDKPGDIIVLQGRNLVTSRLLDGLRNVPGFTAEPAWEGGPEIYRIAPESGKPPLFAVAADASIILSTAHERIRDTIDKRDTPRRTRFSDPTIERGLEYAFSQKFAVFATLGLRQGWAAQVPPAEKINFMALGALLEDRGLIITTLGDETESGKIAELQKLFGQMLTNLARAANPPDLRLQRIATALLEAEPLRIVPKFRRAHLAYIVPARRLDEWLAPFVPSDDK